MPIAQFAAGAASRDNWGTPPALVEACHEDHPFTLDVCATHYNTKVSRYFSLDAGVDGLQQRWTSEICWMNPPYSTLQTWLQKAIDESTNGCTVVALIPARTETKWWRDLVATQAYEIRFLVGRLAFIRDGGHTGSAPFPSAIVIYNGTASKIRTCWWDWRTRTLYRCR